MKKIFMIICTMIMVSTLSSQELKTIDGSIVTINDIVDQKKPTVIVTFALWNAPGLKYIKNAAESYKNIPNDEIKIIAIALDMKRSSINRLEQYSSDWPFNIYLCDDLSINEYLYSRLGQTTRPNIPMIYLCYSGNPVQVVRADGMELDFVNNILLKNSPYFKNNNYDYSHNVGNFFIVSKNKKWGVINNAGSTIIPLQYDKIQYTSNESFIVKQYGRWGMLNKTGNVMISIQYDSIICPFGEKFYIVKKNGKYGLFSINGTSLSPITYDVIETTGNYCRAKMNGTWGVLDNQGKTIIPFLYDYISYSSDFFEAKRNGRYGCLDLQNKIIIPFDYNEISYCGEDYFIAKKDKYGLIQKGNKIIYDFKADEIEFNPKGLTRSFFSIRIGKIWYAAKIQGGCVVCGLTFNSVDEAKKTGAGSVILFKALKEGLDKIDCDKIDDKFLVEHLYYYTGDDK